MTNILQELAAYSLKRAASSRAETPMSELIRTIESAEASGTSRPPFAFEKALSGDGLSFICEVKKASPSKGIIDSEFKYLDIAREYEAAGAECISCLTEPKWFLGSNEIFKEIRSSVSVPMIRKDFTTDEYQIYEAKAMGADAVLLICSILSEAQLKQYSAVCNELGLSALVETHSEDEVKLAASIGARMIGVNNRNLKDFTIDIENSLRLKECAPKDTLFISESGVRDASDIIPLRRAGVDAVLIGEALMRADDKRARLKEFRNDQG